LTGLGGGSNNMMRWVKVGELNFQMAIKAELPLKSSNQHNRLFKVSGVAISQIVHFAG